MMVGTIRVCQGTLGVTIHRADGWHTFNRTPIVSDFTLSIGSLPVENQSYEEMVGMPHTVGTALSSLSR